MEWCFEETIGGVRTKDLDSAYSCAEREIALLFTQKNIVMTRIAGNIQSMASVMTCDSL